jgi:dTDP-glucose 4,6-dehydratase/UDP-glucuronate decarboxylase
MVDLLKKDSQLIINNNYLKDDLYKFADKEILITGATGLLGIHLVSLLKLCDFNFSCICLHNRPCTDYFNKLIEDDTRFETIDTKHFINNCTFYFDIIFHFATYGQPSLFMQNQLDTIYLNTTFTNLLLDHLVGDGRFIYISSSEVYSGLTNDHKETEIGTTTPEHNRACYIESKRCGETICNVYRENNVDVKAIRLCLAYGTGVRLDDGRAINQFIMNGIKNKHITLLDGGFAIRTYIYITDVIEMIIKILFNGKHYIYNVGGNISYMICEVAQKIAGQLEIAYTANNKRGNSDAPNSVKLDITRYEKDFGKKRLINLNSGISRLIEWYKHIEE